LVGRRRGKLEGGVREERRGKRREHLPNRQKCENWWGEGEGKRARRKRGSEREGEEEEERLTKQAKMRKLMGREESYKKERVRERRRRRRRETHQRGKNAKINEERGEERR